MKLTKPSAYILLSLILLSCFASLYSIQPAQATGSTGTIAFHETGLATGTSWIVKLGASNYSSTGDTISQSWIAGIGYPYTVYVPSGYTSTSTLSGIFMVNEGQTTNYYITFTPISTANITFTQTGLASGTNWNITFNDATYSSTSDTITVPDVESGNYQYSIITPSGYILGSASQASLTAAGTNITKTVTFASSASSDWYMTRRDVLHSGYADTTAPLTNNTLWTTTLNAIGASSPAIVDGVLYIGTDNGTIYALNAADGSIIWNYVTGGAIKSSPAVVDGVVYVGSDDLYVYALNATDGSLIWRYNVGGSGLDTSPTVVDGVVYFGEGFELFSLNATDGSLNWQKTLPSTGYFSYSSPTVVDGIIYFGAYNSRLVYALNASDGSTVWSYNTWSHVCSSPTVIDGVVYVGNNEGRLYALNASATADQYIWDVHLGEEGAMFLSSPAYCNGVVYIGDTYGNLYARNASDGSEIWTSTADVIWYSSAAVAGGVVYIGSIDQNVYAFNATDGALIWTYATDEAVYSSPAVVDGVVYIGSADGKVYAFSDPRYTLTLNTVGQGTVTPSNGTYTSGAQVSLEATPAEGWHFGEWSGDASGSSNITLTMDGNKTVTATFLPNSYNLTMITTGQGSVSPGNQTYTLGTVVDLTATSAQGWTFAGWSGNATGITNTSLTMTQNMLVTAAFTQDNYTITILTIGEGSVSPANQTYPSNTPINLEAINAEGWMFSGWSGDTTGTTNKTITLTQNMTITATFALAARNITFDVSGVNSDYTGTLLTVDDVEYNFTFFPLSFDWIIGSNHTYSFASTLGISSGKQYVWVSTDGLATSQSGTLTVSESGTVTADYGTQYKLTVNTPYGSASGSGWYNAGSYATASISQTTITQGSTRQVFNAWSGASSSPSSSTSILMDGAKTATATWTTQYSVTMAVSPAGSGTTTPVTTTWMAAGELSISAKPGSGYSFSSWTTTGSVTLSSQTTNTTATISGPATITANFTPTTTSTTVDAKALKTGQTHTLTVGGNVTGSQMSNVVIQSVAKKTTLTFSIKGPTGTVGFCNLTIPKTAIPTGTTPRVLIDGASIESQGYTQDAQNYYLWYTVHFSEHEVSIEFTSPEEPQQPTLSGLELPAIAAVVILVLVIVGLFLVKRQSKTKP